MSADVSGFAFPSVMTWTQEERDNPTLLYKMYSKMISVDDIFINIIFFKKTINQ